ncbi:hypothetical protein M0R88_02250 [Halorussus gelatinilyticus]|uniref:DUF7344 domain-containing protein n=1 Tax=Halorussus gelatinilyticus TaxID=2937524 RepID=A0A8U0IJS8_9EURY|nr:hypothetical protein [Halorussus gelatinilyticus]UPW00935.1 hypothetical protein M0R88_02250 [Halorussus gelatinilyticus]
MSTIGDSSGTGSTEPEETPDQQDSAVATQQVSDIVESESEEEEEESEPELSRDLVFDVLKNRRRRYALHYLRRAEGSVQLSELAEQVAAWENDIEVDAISAAERKRVYTALYQSHLPKLDDAGIVDYNQNRGIVELSDAAEQLDVYLDLESQPDIPWCNWYLGLAVGGLGLLTGAWLGLPPFSLVADVLLATAVVAAYGAVAVTHTYYARHASGAGETPPEVQES